MSLEESDKCKMGWVPKDFHLLGTDGLVYSLDYFHDASACLILFICNHCPYVQSMMPRLIKDCTELMDAGVKILAIMSNDTLTYPEDNFEKMKEFSALHHLPFPYLIDTSQNVAKTFGAICTPEIYGFNAKLELSYRGRLDDGSMQNSDVTQRDLFDAMMHIIETGQGPKNQLSSIGCSIKWYA